MLISSYIIAFMIKRAFGETSTSFLGFMKINYDSCKFVLACFNKFFGEGYQNKHFRLF